LSFSYSWVFSALLAAKADSMACFLLVRSLCCEASSSS
jgi:hypothetical protein